MVVIMQEPKLIFIEEPRAASRSIHMWLTGTNHGFSPWDNKPWNIAPSQVFSRHMPLPEFESLLFKGKFSCLDWLKRGIGEFDAFAVVRNPFITAVSYYCKAQRGATNWRCRHFEKAIADETNTFTQFLERLERDHPDHLSEEPHMERLHSCTSVLRYEKGLPGELFDFLEERGMTIPAIQRESFPRHGVTVGKTKPWREYYTNRSREIVARIYKEYLRIYDYSFDTDEE